MATLDDYGFSSKDVRKKGRVTESGAVLLGKNFVADAHDDRPVRIVTHVHSDHLKGLNKSLKNCEHVVMTPESLEMLKILYSDRYSDLENVEEVSYGENFEYDGEVLNLHEAKHILGASQALVETKDGVKVLFTGDFKRPGTSGCSCDLMITEATYGEPYQVRPFRSDIGDIFARFVEERLENGSVNILGYHGKLQESLEILREKGIDNPAFMPERIFETAQVYESAGRDLGDFYLLDRLGDGIDGVPIKLFHANSGRDFDVDSIRVRLSGWEFIEPIKRAGDVYSVALSDHSDFHSLIDHVRDCDPDFVITDGSRSNGADRLASEITDRTSVPAKEMP